MGCRGGTRVEVGVTAPSVSLVSKLAILNGGTRVAFLCRRRTLPVRSILLFRRSFHPRTRAMGHPFPAVGVLRPPPKPLPPTPPCPIPGPRPGFLAHPVSSSSSPSHANPCHRSSTREQSNSGFPSRRLTSLCTSHVHLRNAAPEETSGGTRRTTSSKCAAHSAQGYARVIIETRSRASRAC